MRHTSPFAILLITLATTLSHAPAAASDALAAKYACTACHAAAKRVVGPSWEEIGAKYAGGKKTPEALAQAIRKGGSGAWGAIPMPAQAQVPEKDALTLARWLLAPRD